MPRGPDGRTVLTRPYTLNTCNGPVGWARRHLPPFIPDTNSIENLNRQIRKSIKTRGHFPDEQAATKLIYLAIVRSERKWLKAYNWTGALRGLKIHFGDRLPD